MPEFARLKGGDEFVAGAGGYAVHSGAGHRAQQRAAEGLELAGVGAANAKPVRQATFGRGVGRLDVGVRDACGEQPSRLLCALYPCGAEAFAALGVGEAAYEREV